MDSDFSSQSCIRFVAFLAMRGGRCRAWVALHVVVVSLALAARTAGGAQVPDSLKGVQDNKSIDP